MRPKPGIETIQPYQGGTPIEEVQRELGIHDVIKLASNENPLGPSQVAVDAMAAAAKQLHLYPDGNAFYLKRDLAAHLNVNPDQLILGNGSNEVLQIVGDTFLSPGERIVYSQGAFVVYELVAKTFGALATTTPLRNDTHDLDAMASSIASWIAFRRSRSSSLTKPISSTSRATTIRTGSITCGKGGTSSSHAHSRRFTGWRGFGSVMELRLPTSLS